MTTLTDKMKQKTIATPNNLLLVSQTDPPQENLPSIPGTDEETELISTFVKGVGIGSLRLAGVDATTIKVKEQMDLYSSIHLACHGRQEREFPLKSCFYLGDGQLELSEIMKHQLPNADLAFLSACQTGTGDLSLSEEAVHLAAGMLAAGYRSVVATMWSIDDSYGPHIAQQFYQFLLRDKTGNGVPSLNGANAADALHLAAQHLREKVGDTEMGFSKWVPYVHFGI